MQAMRVAALQTAAVMAKLETEIPETAATMRLSGLELADAIQEATLLRYLSHSRDQHVFCSSFLSLLLAMTSASNYTTCFTGSQKSPNVLCIALLNGIKCMAVQRLASPWWGV